MSLPVKSLPAPGSRISLWIEWASEVLCELPEGGKKEARLLLSELLSDPIAPWTKDREVLPVTLSERYQDWVDRRSRREPFHLITGSVPFMDARFEVAPGVLLPRPETESVVESVLDFLDCRAPSCILDLGCGCGILGITFLKKFSQARCLSVDFMETPLDLTAKNALLHGVNDRMHLIRGDWTEMIRPSRRFDLVVSNPPYIPSEVIPGLAERPPGHHALSGRAMGFCIVNHTAAIAWNILHQDPEARVAVLDFDVHHGNGTEEILRGQDRCLFISTHQYPFYPGTGSGRDNSDRRQGEGILDIPLAEGTDDSDYHTILREQILPRLERFRPTDLIVSAGFDAHRDDPLGGLLLTEETYHEIGNSIRKLDCRFIASVLEGGYNLEALSRSVEAYLNGIGS